MVTKKTFRRGTAFPNEGFVQTAIERHFTGLGFTRLPEGSANLVCRHLATGEEWVVEAKGETKAVGLDFRTGLGQLLQRMNASGMNYGLAVPDTPQFINQCKQVPERVRAALQLHWLIISDDGNVRVILPSESL